MIILALLSNAKIINYEPIESMTNNDMFKVEVRQQGDSSWIQMPVYPVKVDHVSDARHNVEISSMAYFDFDGIVEVKVTSKKAKVYSCRIRPLYYNINSQIHNNTVTFTLDKPRNLSVEVNGDIFNNLHLFANPIDKNRPTPKQIKNHKKEKLIYFGPGIHILPADTMLISSGYTVYIDGGAMVYGTLIADRVSDVKFHGRGEVHPKGRGFGVEIRNSKNIEVDGIIVTQCPVGGSNSVKVTNVKSISSYGWGDGLNVFASNDIHYDGCFCRNSDDCSTVYATRKGYTGGCKNILMENCTLWADVAHPIMIGLHGNPEKPDTIENICYRNIDILDHSEMQIDYQGCIGISCGDMNLVRNLTFENIRVEDFRHGQLVNIRVCYNNKYCTAPGDGIENVLIKNLSYNGYNTELSIISGYDQNHKVKNIIFDNLRINGEKISDNMTGKPSWYKTGDMARIYVGEHVENVVFK
ncbi:MAG: endo-polygalacturonase [Bacteroidaceae bacterium]|nr:endo-polygalacturonase [Bacteroidaceae bacterium]